MLRGDVCGTSRLSAEDKCICQQRTRTPRKPDVTCRSPSIFRRTSCTLDSVADPGTPSSVRQAETAAPERSAAEGRAKALPLAPPSLESIPGMVPARMLNEILYCERLMYLEWVQGEWSDNRYTVDGKAVHKRVDQRPQVLKLADSVQARRSGEQPSAADYAEDPEPSGEERPYTARSVWLSSGRFGITAKVDVVDVAGQQVVPIEYKRGRCPEQGPYLPERAQLAAQVMLLRDHGYQCEAGELY